MNIIYFFCDELRQDALGCYGNPAGPMLTPHIDSIAAHGVLFENCFCNSPVCVPSRTSLLTGLYPEETAVYDNEAMTPTFHMARTAITFPEVLAQNGYHTANFGKTHLPQELRPFEIDNHDGSSMTLGLTKEEIHALDKIMPHSGFSFNAASLYPAEKEYYPEVVTANALSWIKEQTEPYFVRISYTQPHSPIILKRGYETLYQDYPFSDTLPDISHLSLFERSFANAIGLNTLSKEELQTIQCYYYGMVAWIDDQVGQILDYLKTQNQLENTILIINADHGALRGECQGLGKHIFHRASQAVPLIFSAPGMASGIRVSHICSNLDIAKTLFGLLGIEAPEQFHGTNLLSFLSFPEEVYATIGYGEPDSYAFPARQLGRLPENHGWPRRACIRTQQYRLDISSRIDAAYTTEENEDLFFVDTRQCPAEDRNMASLPEYAEVIQELSVKLRTHLKHCAEVDPATLHFPENYRPQKQ